jgi:hypothetical protein
VSSRSGLGETEKATLTLNVALLTPDAGNYLIELQVHLINRHAGEGHGFSRAVTVRQKYKGFSP